MNATLAAMVNEISEKMKQQKEEKITHCAENDGLRQQIEVMPISFVGVLISVRHFIGMCFKR